MSSIIENITNIISSSSFNLIQIIAILYIGLLWLSIIIWITRDSINRSNSILFQSFSILINIIVPILGVLFYLIIRPNKTNSEQYYEEMEQRLLLENTESKSTSCEKCLTIVDKNFAFCPNCGVKIKKTCTSCKKSFPSIWNICPFCGKGYKEKKKATKGKKK